MKKLFILMFVMILLVGSVSAGILDIKVEYKDKDAYTLNEKVIPYNDLWVKYPPLKIDSFLTLGKTKFSGAIVEHTESCGDDCLSQMEIYIADEGPLLDGIEFKELSDKGKWADSRIRSYQFYIYMPGQTEQVQVFDYNCWDFVPGYKVKIIGYDNETNAIWGLEPFPWTECESIWHYEYLPLPDWREYQVGDVLPAGEYTIKLVGEKKPSDTVDWIIETQGKKLTEWATWGNISEGDDAEVILLSPPDNFESLTGTEDFLCELNMSDGAYLVNLTFWNNESGSWEQKEFFENKTTLVSYGLGGSSTYGSGYGIWEGDPIYMNLLGNLTSLDGYYIKNFTAELRVLAGGSGGSIWSRLKITYQNGSIHWTPEVQAPQSVWTLREFTLPTIWEDEKIKWASIWARTDKGTVSMQARYGTFYGKNSTLNGNETFTGTFADPIIWNCEGCDSDGDCGFAPADFHVGPDITPPDLNVYAPNETFDYMYQDYPLELNFTATAPNIDSCWYDYNGTNKSVSCIFVNYTHLNLSENLHAYYKHDSVTGNVLIDEMNNQNGVSSGVTIEQSGLIDNATLYTDDSVALDYIRYREDDDFSLCGWFKPDSTSNSEVLLSQFALASQTKILLSITNAGKVYFTVDSEDTSDPSVTSSASYDTDWNFICGLYDGSQNNLTLYLDGVNQGSAQDAGLSGSGPLFLNSQFYFGRLRSSAAADYSGDLDEWGIWNKTLTAEEVTFLYENGNDGNPIDNLYYGGNVLFQYEPNVDTLNVWTNDTLGNSGSKTTTWGYKILENEITYNSVTYQLKTEDYSINVTANSSLTDASFIYDGTNYATTESSGVYSSTIDIPGDATGSKDFGWNFTYAGENITSPTSSQTVSETIFILCNATYPTKFLNISFKDESDGAWLNATNDLTDTTYYIAGGGSETKSYITSDPTENWDYDFCFEPADEGVYVSMTFKYSKDDYPLRSFSYTDQLFTNTTTHATLYLLSQDDGIYSTISVINTAGGTIEGATLTVERQFSGVWTVIGQEITGSDGAATFWVNPNFQHRITAVAAGYVATTVTITPSQSLYTLTMQSAEGNASYTSEIEGTKWIVLPASGRLTPGTYDFNATVWSAEENLENCKLELINMSDISQVLASVTGVTNSSYCFIEVNYAATAENNLFGRLSLDTTGSIGFVIVDADWKWILLDIDVKGWRTFTSFFADLATLSDFGEGNEADFSRLVFFFILVTILIGAFNYFSGIEISSPGISILVIWLIVMVASAAGFLAYNSGSENVSSIIEQWAAGLLFSLIAINYILTTIRRSQR